MVDTVIIERVLLRLAAVTLLLVANTLQPCRGARPAACPKWISEYEQWHQANRALPSARYLVAAPQLETRNGLGDRVRGMLFAARVAASAQRVLLVTWDLPGEPDILEFLQPAGKINWTLPGTPVRRAALLHGDHDSEVHTWGVGARDDYVRERASITRGGYESPARVLVMRSNEFPNTTCAGCVPLDSPDDAACVFTALFRASSEVARRAQAQLDAMYPGVKLPALLGSSSSSEASTGAGTNDGGGAEYTALHLRLGMPGERHFQTMWQHRGIDADPLSVLVHAVSCALALKQRHSVNGSSVPLLLLTDNAELRSFASRGHLRGVITSTAPVVHLGREGARGDNTDATVLEAYYSVFVELVLLAGARCLVLSPSGFSTTAWYLGGGTSCLANVRDCIATCTRDPHSPVCAT
jgi:hypothetical protein